MLKPNEIVSDAELVQRTLSGQSTGFALLAERHFSSVFAVALARLRDRETAEELLRSRS